MPQPLLSNHALEIVESPSATPITVAEVKAQLRVEHNDDDMMIARLIEVAVAYVDARGVLGHAMMTQKWAQWMGPNPSQAVSLSIGPVQDVTAVKYYDVDGVLQTDTLTNYQNFGTGFNSTIGPKDGFSWPVAQNRPDAIRIEYRAGYGSVKTDGPQGIRHAMMLLVGHWYDNREQSQMDRLENIPYGFEELLNISRLSWYG
jgi:uncharacterized phiE125 gp8 family phage protein